MLTQETFKESNVESNFLLSNKLAPWKITDNNNDWEKESEYNPDDWISNNE